MSLTKAHNRMIAGAQVNVLDYVPASLRAGVLDGTNATNLQPYIQAAVDALLPYQTLVAAGYYLMDTEVKITASNNVYDFRAAKFTMTGAVYTGFGAGILIGDPAAKTVRPTNITILGGEYYPAGDAAAYPLANYNPIAVLIGESILIDNPKIFPVNSTRAVSLQTDNTYGDGIVPNIQNVQIINLEVYGDGDAPDGLDITSVGADNLVQDVYVQGFISGCKRCVNISTGSNSYNFTGIDLDIVGRGATEVGCNFLRVKKSSIKLKLLDVTKAGAVLQQIDDVDADIFITGTGGALVTALHVVEATAVVNMSRVKAFIQGPFTTGISPQHNGVSYPEVTIDGCTTGIDVSGYRSVWGLVVFKNCAAPCDNFEAVTDKWLLAVTFGAGAEPVVLKRESDFSTTFTSTDATPNVKGMTFCRTAGATAITAFDNGTIGQQITLMADQTITITQGTNIKLAAGANYVMTLFDTLTLVQYTADVWVEVSRSVNA